MEFTPPGEGAESQYFHVPADGIATLRTLADTLTVPSPEFAPLSTAERLVAPMLWMLDAVQGVMLPIGKLAFAVVAISLMLAPFDLPEWLTLRPVLIVLLPLTLLGFFVVFLGSAVGARVLARLFDEPVAIGHVRLIHGPARRVQVFGSWQPSVWPTLEYNTLRKALLHTCLVASQPPRLVVALTKQTPTTEGSEVYALDQEQIPALLSVLDRLETLRA